MKTLINTLPFELHIPGYQYCGSGTQLEKRLSRNDPGINLLDRACKDDIAYTTIATVKGGNKPDEILEQVASERVRGPDASISEKRAEVGVKCAMRIKRKFGMGLKRKTKKRLKL